MQTLTDMYHLSNTIMNNLLMFGLTLEDDMKLQQFYGDLKEKDGNILYFYIFLILNKFCKKTKTNNEVMLVLSVL